MAANSKIEWTEATWNPIVGCSIVSPGCTNCYAMKAAARSEVMGISRYHGTTKKVNGKVVWTGKVAKAPNSTWLVPIERKKPTTYFVNSMGDLFHEDCPDEWILDALTVMAIAHQHTFQVLTKRADRMHEFMSRPRLLEEIYLNWFAWSGGAREVRGWPLPNVWLGVSTERQEEANVRIPRLLRTPAAIRFISAEPLLGPIDLSEVKVDFMPGYFGDALMPHHVPYCDRHRRYPKLDWVIVGGESGHNARPMSIQWARELRDQCHAAGVPFFFKQWGEWAPAGLKRSGTPGRFAFGDYEYDRTAMVRVDEYPGQFTKFGARSVVEHVGKRAAGRLLDGIEHSSFPHQDRQIT